MRAPLHVLVTAGPTREFLDPVRFLSNRSSGKMGYAIAREAARRGHEVVLVSGPVCLSPPAACRVVPVVSAADMLAAVSDRLDGCHVLVMCAAVADWRPASVSPRKLKKTGAANGGTALSLALERTPDILETLAPRKGNRLFVGFAAETHDLLAEAERKRACKGLDLIVANDVSRSDAGFEADTNQVTLLAADGTCVEWPLLTKAVVAARLLDWIETRVRPA